MHQNKNLQVMLLSAGRNTGRNCNQSAFHMNASRGDDSDGIILQISFMKQSPPRKAAVLELVLVEVNILTYWSHLEWVSEGKNRREWTFKETIPILHFPLEVSSCPQPLFPTALKLPIALFTYNFP